MTSRKILYIVWHLQILLYEVVCDISSPEFVLEPPSKIYISNIRGVNLRCAALGSPPPTITWVDLEGNAVQNIPGIRETSVNGSLWVGLGRSASNQPQLRLRCKATNLAGTVISRSTKVIVVIPESLSPRVEASPARVGGISTLKCWINSNVPMEALVTTWFQQKSAHEKPILIPDAGRYIYGTSGTLYLIDVTKEDGRTRFQCRVTPRSHLRNPLAKTSYFGVNEEPSVNSSPTKIRVLEVASTDSEPRIDPSVPLRMEVADGSPFTIPCIAYAKPSPKFSWTKEGYSDRFPITTLSNALGISMPSSSELWARGPILGTGRARSNHQGTYNCIVANSRGSDRSDFDLTVLQELKASILPQHQTVSAGGRAVIRCSVYGSPVLDVKWFKDGRPLVHYDHIMVQRREIIIGGASERDVGVYQCIASNSLGEAQAASYLSIRESTPKLVHQFIEQTLQPGPAVSLTCAALGHPTPSISWLRDGVHISRRSSMMYSNSRVSVGSRVDGNGQVVGQVNISSVTLMDGGLYECKVSNRIATISHSARLNVHGPPSSRAPANLTAINKRAAILPCPVTGYPLMDIQWLIDSRPISPTLRRFVKRDGTLHIREVDSSQDSKRYSCTATNSQGLFATASFFLSVLNPPVLAAIKFPDNLFEGMRLSVLCTLLEGDVPITLRWTREGGARIPEDPTVSQSHAHFYSNLVFMRVQGRHAGKYSCTASNAAASTSVSAIMNVKVPPVWVVEPEDVHIVSGEDFILECHSAGTPLPAVTWRRPKGDLSLTDSPEVSSDGWRITIPRPGSLRIRSARPQDGGRYLCHANNGVIPSLSKVITVQILEGAKIDGLIGNHTVGIGRRLDLECRAKGQQPIFFTWSQNGKPLISTSLPGGISMMENKHSQTSIVSLIKASREQAAMYVCQAANAYGVATKTFFVNIVENPDSPSHVQVVDTTSRNLSLAWAPPFDGNSPLTHYVIQLQERPGPSSITNVTIAAGKTKATIRNLLPGTKYDVTVVAFNELGSSKSSVVLSFTTKMERPLLPPTKVKAVPKGGGVLALTWQPSLGALKDHVSGYQVGHRVDRALDDYKWKSIRASVLSLDLRHLNHFTTYEVVVRATNQVGMGPLSPPVKATTKQAAPTASPLNVDCTPLSSKSVRVRWNSIPTSETHGPIQGYKVLFKKLSNLKDFARVEMKRTTNLETNLQALQPYTNYSLILLAFNMAGDGKMSNQVICTTLEDKPGPPASIKALNSGQNAVLVSWLPPIQPNGIIIHYTLYYRLLNARKEIIAHIVDQINLSSSPWEEFQSEVSGLNEHSHYEFWVTATTRVGEGGASNVVAQNPSGNVAAKIKSFGQEVKGVVTSSLALPCNVLGFPPPSVVWSKHMKTLPDHSLLFTSLQKHHEGNYSCQVKNVHGKDSETWLVKVVSVPPAPNLYITRATEKSIGLSWLLNGNGGEPIVAIVLAYRRDVSDKAVWRETEVTTSTESNFLLHDVLCGSIYSLRILAVNSVGRGEFSKTITTRTRGSEPMAPRAVDLITVNSTAITVHLYTWPSTGCPISYVIVAHRQQNTAFTSPVKITDSSDSYVINFLAPMTWYDIKITAVNSAGSTHVFYKVGTSSPNGERLAEQTIIEVQQIGTKVPAYRDPHVLAPIVSGVACTLAFLLCISIAISRGSCICKNKRKKSDDDLKEGRSSLLLRKGFGRSNESREKLSPAARAKEDEIYGVNESTYEICPYASFDPNVRTLFPGSPQEIQTLDYSLQFQTFGHQECLEEPQKYLEEPQKYLEEPRGCLEEPQVSPEVRCISNDQTLPVGSAAAIARFSRRGDGNNPVTSTAESNREGTSEDIISYSGISEDYRIPIKLNRGSDFNFYRRESSTESNDERSPQRQTGFLRNFIHQKNEFSKKKQSNVSAVNRPKRSKASVYSVESTISSQESCVETPLRPPSGFLDSSKEFSGAECDKDQITKDQQKISKRKRANKTSQPGSDYTIHV